MPKTRSKEKVPTDSDRFEALTGGDVKLAWEWEGDGGVWTSYSDEHSDQLTNTAIAGKSKVSLVAKNNTKFQVLLDKMVQKNSTTGWERRIRWVIFDGTDRIQWEWLDDKGKPIPYSPTITYDLEHAMSSGEGTLEFTALERKYAVDFVKMEQKNIATSVTRKVKRVVEGVETAKEEEDPACSAGSSKASGVKRKATVAVKYDNDEDEEEEEEELVPKKAKHSSGSRSKSGNMAENEKGKSTVRTVVVKGKAPVDAMCEARQSHHVFHEGNDIYDVMLNQTNVGNNNNKFYLIQLLEEDGKKKYVVWFRWGRVGFRGQSTLTRCGGDLDQAKKLFCQKFTEKTKNDWSNRKSFQKVPGKYDMVALDYSAKEKPDENGDKPAKPAKKTDSKLPKEIQRLITLICDIKEMEDAIIEMKYDTRKAPLGRLTTDQIKAGYSALKTIDQLIEKKDFGQRLTEACNDFYTRIPHDFRMSRPPIIRTKDDIKEKMTLLEALGDIEIAMRILQESKANESPIDSQYKSLRCDIQLMDNSDPTYKIIEDYLTNTHAPTHNQYKMKLLNVFCVDREGENARFKDVGNRILLWHGSRLTNMVGIISQGLRVAPPEAPVTGYMFGKGIYFADMSSKSANYCFATHSRNTGLLMLCEVSLGNMHELLAADYNADKLSKGKHSVKGLGKIGPDPSKNVKLPDGTLVPVGKPVDTGVNNAAGYTLNYNEYIVYDPAQVKMKYALQVQFDFC